VKHKSAVLTALLCVALATLAAECPVQDGENQIWRRDLSDWGERGPILSGVLVGDQDEDGLVDVLFTTARDGDGANVIVVSGRQGPIVQRPQFVELQGMPYARAIDLRSSNGSASLLLADDKCAPPLGDLITNRERAFVVQDVNAAGRLVIELPWGSNCGHDAVMVSDWDGDLTDDILIGCPGMGGAVVVSGSSGGLLHEFQCPEPDSSFGSSIATVGDINGDGRSEIAIGAPGVNGKGKIFLCDGADLAEVWSVSGTIHREFFANHVSTCDDLSGDGVPDVLASSYGGVVILDAAHGTLLRRLMVPGSMAFQASDWDVDGTKDFVVCKGIWSAVPSATSYDFQSSCSIVSGTSGGLIHQVPFPGEVSVRVVRPADVNGDGYIDIVAFGERTVIAVSGKLE
jgi:hypothetical protein